MIWAQIVICVALLVIGELLRPASDVASKGHRYNKARQFSRRSTERVKVKTGLFKSEWVLTGSRDE
jgi:hypothetical protein